MPSNFVWGGAEAERSNRGEVTAQRLWPHNSQNMTEKESC